MDEDFQRFLDSIETTREQAVMGLHVAMPSKSRSELDHVVRAVGELSASWDFPQCYRRLPCVTL